MMNWMGNLQQFGRALMLPMIALPAVAVLLCLSVIPWELLGLVEVSRFFADAASAILLHLPYIFAVGVALGLTESAGMAGLSGLLGYFIFERLVGHELELGVSGGILFGLLAALCFHLFKNIKFPESLQFFGGPRFTPFVMALASLVLSSALLIIGPFLQTALDTVGQKLIELGGFGSFLYGTVHRLLVPFGLHHILNNFTWFQVGTYEQPSGEVFYGDVPRFFAGDPEAGLYMAGMYPLMMFAVPAIALAIIHEARKTIRANISKIFITAALTAMLTGVTEPIEFAFVFIAPLLFVVHALLAGSMMWVCAAFDIHHGFAFSAGAIDYILNFHLSKNGWLILPIGLLYGVFYYFFFRWAIRRFQLATPGRGQDISSEDADSDLAHRAPLILHSLGGKENIVRIEACITRLRLTLKNERLLDENGLMKLGSMGVIRLGGGNVQVVFGTFSELIREQMLDLMKHDSLHVPLLAPIEGERVQLEDVPDQVFSGKLLGDGVAIMPTSNLVVAPVAGRITQIYPTKHALVITTDEGLNILLHIGLDTVELKGEGFQLLINEQQSVQAGQALVRLNLAYLAKHARSTCTIMVITNMKLVEELLHSPFKTVRAGKDIVFNAHLKSSEGGDSHEL
jgi:glucose-specific phosphotransferase system IIA component